MEVISKGVGTRTTAANTVTIHHATYNMASGRLAFATCITGIGASTNNLLGAEPTATLSTALTE